LVKFKVKDNHELLHKIRVAQKKHGLLVEHGRQGLTSSLQRTKGKIMEPQTEEKAQKMKSLIFGASKHMNVEYEKQ
jgi:hypothetical protein